MCTFARNDNKKKMMISSFLSFIKVSKVLPLMGKCVAKWLKSWDVDIILIIFLDNNFFKLLFILLCILLLFWDNWIQIKSNKNISKKNIIEEISSKIVSESDSWNDIAPQKTWKVIGVDFIPRLQVCQAMSCWCRRVVVANSQLGIKH